MMNYKYTQGDDGTYTIHDVEVLQLGRWRGRGTGPDGMEFGDAEATAILEADAEVRASTSIRPVLKTKHRNPLGEDGEIVGFLSPFKRAGDRIVATIRGVPEAVFKQIEAGRAGWLSPDIVPDWINSVTEKTHKLFMRAVSFTGGSLPAMQSLKPLASVEFDSAVLEREIQLDHLIREAQDAGEPVATVSFGDRPKEREATETKKEVAMAEEMTAQALQEKEKTFAENQRKWEEERAQQIADLKRQRLSTAWEGIVGKTANPSEEKTFMDVGMELSEAGLKAHIEAYKSRPPIEQKNTDPKGSTQADAPPEMSFEDRVIARADEIAEKRGLSFTEALPLVEHSLTQSEREELAAWHAGAFPNRTRGGN